jgi:hypothetical protein
MRLCEPWCTQPHRSPSAFVSPSCRDSTGPTGSATRAWATRYAPLAPLLQSCPQASTRCPMLQVAIDVLLSLAPPPRCSRFPLSPLYLVGVVHIPSSYDVALTLFLGCGSVAVRPLGAAAVSVVLHGGDCVQPSRVSEFHVCGWVQVRMCAAGHDILCSLLRRATCPLIDDGTACCRGYLCSKCDVGYTAIKLACRPCKEPFLAISAVLVAIWICA